jgi:hypothetical protein
LDILGLFKAQIDIRILLGINESRLDDFPATAERDRPTLRGFHGFQLDNLGFRAAPQNQWDVNRFPNSHYLAGIVGEER